MESRKLNNNKQEPNRNYIFMYVLFLNMNIEIKIYIQCFILNTVLCYTFKNTVHVLKIIYFLTNFF